MDANQPQYIEIRQNRAGQDRPYVAGSRVRVQDIVLYHERFGQSAEEIARQLPHLTIAQVHAALAFFFEDREVVWNCIREDEAFAEQMQVKQAAMTPPASIVSDATSPSVSS